MVSPVRFLEPDGMERGVKEGSSSFPPRLPSNGVQVRGGVVWGWGILGNVASCRLCGGWDGPIIVHVSETAGVFHCVVRLVCC